MTADPTPRAPTEAIYQVYGQLRDLWDAPGVMDAPEVLVEGPAGTGKSRGMLELMHARCTEYPGSRHLIARQTRVSLTESILVTYENKVLTPGYVVPADVTRANRHSYEYYNGSEIIVGGLDNPDRIMSTEYDTILVAEATEATEDAWEKLLTRLRNAVMPYQQAQTECNPGAPGHWLNKRALRGKMRRLKTYHADNPSLSAAYLATLANLSGHRRARLFEGLWVAAEGGVFAGDFQEERNVIIPWPHGPPSGWPVWVYCDPGRDHPCSVNWYTMAPSGKRIMFHELYGREFTIQDVTDGIRRYNRQADCHPRGYFLDPRHGFKKTFEAPRTIAEQFHDKGIDFMPYKRFQGPSKQDAVQNEATMLQEGTLLFTRDCVMSIEEHQTWAYKRLASGETPQGDDAYEDRKNHSIDNTMAFCAAGHKRDEPVIVDEEAEARRWFAEQERIAAAGDRPLEDQEGFIDLGRE